MVSKGKKVEISGQVEGYEIMEGQKYSFIVNDGTRKYSVGGKTATLEDVAMHRLYLYKPTTVKE